MRLKKTKCFQRRLFIAITIIFMLLGTSVVFSQNVHFKARKMNKSELAKFKKLVGISKAGENYNKKFNGHGTGLKPPTAEKWEKIAQSPIMAENLTFAVTEAPAYHDNSATIWFPPIGDQDGEGSCVAWATTYYTKTFQEAYERNWDLSAAEREGVYPNLYPTAAYQDKIASPDFIYHQINGGADNGSWYDDAMNCMYEVGACSWLEMPYDPGTSTTWPSESAWREAPIYRSGSGYNVVNFNSDTEIEDLKLLLTNYNLGIISVDAGKYSSFPSDKDLWTLDNYINPNTNHANTIVGFDDNYGPYTEDGVTRYGAFKVANSWGETGWQDLNQDGCYWISYECMKQRIGYYMFYTNRDNYEPRMIAVFDITHTRRGECLISAGIGDTGGPLDLKYFNQGYNGGSISFPPNKIILDVTEFMEHLGSSSNVFLGIYDGGSGRTGTLNSLVIEKYANYSSQPEATYYSDNTPLRTSRRRTVYATVTVE